MEVSSEDEMEEGELQNEKRLGADKADAVIYQPKTEGAITVAAVKRSVAYKIDLTMIDLLRSDLAFTARAPLSVAMSPVKRRVNLDCEIAKWQREVNVQGGKVGSVFEYPKSA